MLKVLKEILKWNVRRYFRVTYRLSGKGIAEIYHRTIKTISKRESTDIMSSRTGQ